MLEEESASSQLEERKKTVVYVLKFLQKVYSDFKYDDDTIGIWMELLENVPNDAMVKAVKEWCKLNSSKPVIADFRTTAITKSPYSAIKKELKFRLFKDDQGNDFAELLN